MKSNTLQVIKYVLIAEESILQGTKSGSVVFKTEPKFVVHPETLTEGVDFDDVELELIDAGLEESEMIDGGLLPMGIKPFGSLSQAAQTLSVTIKKASLRRIPNSALEFSGEQLVSIRKSDR